MFGYRHAFHAANHGDVLKHMVLCDCLEYLILKEKPILYADTHAGAGAYSLNEGFAAQNREWEEGLVRLKAYAETETPPAMVRRYFDHVSFFQQSASGVYPGSPALAAMILRPCDSLSLFELHPSDHEELLKRFSRDKRVRVRRGNGFSGLKSVLPPLSRRALVLMDPSYEIDSDYDKAVEAFSDGLRRFSTGTFILWYPLLERPEARAIPERIAGISDRPCLLVSLRVRSLEAGERGLAGSGMVVFNPPWPLESSLREALPYLSRAVSRNYEGGWKLDSLRGAGGE